MRENGALYYLLGDHVGLTAITANASGGFFSELRYKPWRETRYSNGSRGIKNAANGISRRAGEDHGQNGSRRLK